MGIIRAAIDSIGGGLADSWLEVIEPSEMDMRTVFAPGVSVPQGRNDKRNSNTRVLQIQFPTVLSFMFTNIR